MHEEELTRARRRGRILSHVGGFVFYATLIAIVVVFFFFVHSTNGATRSIFGYSAMTVLTPSMQSELPQGCLILVKEVAPETLEVGDNITFLLENNTTVTHKIVHIYNDYGEDRLPAFQTKGTENSMPDDDIVIAPNVVGKVVFHSTVVGDTMRIIKEYWLIMGLMLIFAIGLIIALRVFFKNAPMKEASYASVIPPVETESTYGP